MEEIKVMPRFSEQGVDQMVSGSPFLRLPLVCGGPSMNSSSLRPPHASGRFRALQESLPEHPWLAVDWLLVDICTEELTSVWIGR